MRYFNNLNEVIASLEADPSTIDTPIKREFLFDGQYLTANLAIIRDTGNALHTQKQHDEIVVIIEGVVDFRVGEETRSVKPGDIIFIPQNTLHGPILNSNQRFAALSVFAPFFDRSKPNIDWDKDQ